MCETIFFSSHVLYDVYVVQQYTVHTAAAPKTCRQARLKQCFRSQLTLCCRWWLFASFRNFVFIFVFFFRVLKSNDDAPSNYIPSNDVDLLLFSVLLTFECFSPFLPFLLRLRFGRKKIIVRGPPRTQFNQSTADCPNAEEKLCQIIFAVVIKW